MSTASAPSHAFIGVTLNSHVVANYKIWGVGEKTDNSPANALVLQVLY